MTNISEKNITYTIFAFCILYFTSCLHEDTVYKQLHQAEVIIDTMPDSALTILRNIDNKKLSDKNEAIYSLLQTQALDKSYHIHTSDSLIKIAVAYFEKNEDIHYTPLSYYYMGRINADMQDALQAQKFYLKALVACEKSDDAILKGLICNNLGTLYMYQDIFDMALPMYERASELMIQTGDSTKTSFILRNIARIFSETNKLDSAYLYYQKAINYSTTESAFSIYNDLSSLYIKTGKYEEAYQNIQRSIKSTSDSKRLFPLYLTMGEYYIKTEQYDSAQVYLTKSLESPLHYTQAGSLYYLREIEKNKSNYENYFKYSELYNVLKDSINRNSHFENIRFIQSMFSYQRIEDEKLNFEQKAIRRMIAIYQLLAVFVLIIAAGIILRKREQRKKENLLKIKERLYKQSQQYIEDNNKKIESLENQISSNENKISEYQLQLFEARKLMLEMENRHVRFKQDALSIMEKDFKSSLIYLRVHKAEGILSSSEWLELGQLIDATYSDFTQRLIQAYPRITIEELHVCYLVKMNAPVKKIAILMNRTPSSISQCRRRLYKKLTGEEANAEKFDQFIADF